MKRRHLKHRYVDSFTLAGIQAGKQFDKRMRQFQWDVYSELAFQRSQIIDKIQKALLAAAVDRHEFQRWQRVVRYRWSLSPLSAAGSLTLPGGRFNIGDIDKAFRRFPALYLAADKATALQEVLGQDATPGGKLTPLELALTKPTSVVNISMSGRIGPVIDLGKPDRLKGFIDLIKGFRLKPDTWKAGRQLAKEAGVPVPRFVVTSLKDLLNAVLAVNWRELPMQLGIPSTSQVFGQLVADTGIEGILFTSKFNGQPCVAVFPEAFAGSSSSVSLDDKPPRADVVTVLDRTTWQRLAR